MLRSMRRRRIARHGAAPRGTGARASFHSTTESAQRNLNVSRSRSTSTSHCSRRIVQVTLQCRYPPAHGSPHIHLEEAQSVLSGHVGQLKAHALQRSVVMLARIRVKVILGVLVSGPSCETVRRAAVFVVTVVQLGWVKKGWV